MLGRHGDVQRYFEARNGAGLEGFRQKDFVLFSRYLNNPPTSFEGSKVTATKNIVEVGGFIPTGVRDDRVKQFRLRSDTEPATFSVLLHYSTVPWVIKPDMSRCGPVP